MEHLLKYVAVQKLMALIVYRQMQYYQRKKERLHVSRHTWETFHSSQKVQVK